MGHNRQYNGIPIQAVGATVNPGAHRYCGSAALRGRRRHIRGGHGCGIQSRCVVYGNTSRPAVSTELTLLTLDVRSNQPNFPTFVPSTFTMPTRRCSQPSEFVFHG